MEASSAGWQTSAFEARTTAFAVRVSSPAIIVTVPYSIAVSKPRRAFLFPYNRCFSVAVRRPKRGPLAAASSRFSLHQLCTLRKQAHGDEEISVRKKRTPQL
jgi:hypothetical protein